MKLETPKQDVSISGDFVTSDFAVGDLAFIVDMFADKVYTHKERAVIRELACNAHDSHTQAGNVDDNFKVHLPTHLEPWFSIRDFGTGLSDSQVRTIFAGIGISTKRDSNEQIGCFGIGSLSPYSLCDSFTVKSYYEGSVRTYSCYRDEERKPIVAQLSEEGTSEPNGLEVSLTIDGKVGKFEEEAINVFKWWDYTPEINSKNVVNRCDEWRLQYDFQGEDYALNMGWGDMFAVMGNIAYKIPDELDTFNCDGYIRFELGEINFDTARENMSLDDKTRASIEAKVKRIREEIGDEAVAMIKLEDTAFKQAVVAEKFRSGQLGRLISKKSLQQFELPHASSSLTYWKRAYRSTDSGQTHILPLSTSCEYYLHKDRMQTRIKHYLKDVAPSGTILVVLTQEQADETLLDHDLLKDMEDLPKVPRQTCSGTGSKVKTFTFNGKYSGYTPENFWEETELEDKGQEMVYVEISRWRPVGPHSLISDSNRRIKSTLETIEEHGVEAPVVMGLKTAFLKTKKFDSGNFIHLDEYVKRELSKVAPSTFYEYDSCDADKIRSMSKFMESDELTEFVELIKSSKNDELAGICKRIGIECKMTEDTSLQDWMDTFFGKYEMLTMLNEWEIARSREKVARYIGATMKTPQ